MSAIALPIVVSQGCDTIARFADRIFLSRLGADMMNAAMGGWLTAFMMTTFFIGLTGYVTAVAAQCLGAGRKESAAVVTTQAVIIISLAYPLILAFRPLVHNVFSHIGIAPLQLRPQKVYFDILLVSMPFILLTNTLNGFFSGIGKTRFVMIASLIAMAVNIAANYVLIFGKWGFPALGIKGAGYGTILASACGTLILLIAYFGKPVRSEYKIKKSFYFDRLIMGKLIKFGSPAGMEYFLSALAADVVLMIFHAGGAVAATAATIMFNWDMIAYLPIIGLEIGVTSLVGRYRGAGNPNIADQATVSGIKVGFIFAGIMMILFLGFPGVLTDVFQGENNGIFVRARPAVITMLRISSLYLLLEAIWGVYIGAMRGAGDTLWAMWISVGTDWLPVPLLYYLMHHLHASPEVVWAMFVYSFLIAAIFLFWRYHSGKWRKIKIITKKPLLMS